ncbi:MAG: hypothetical protein WAL30_06585 [Candidatus Aquirickettsiella sp.]
MQELLIDIDPVYMEIRNYKKLFIRQTLTYLIRFINTLIKIIIYFFKFSLRSILTNIVKIIPYFIKRRILSTVYYYPKIVVLLKFFRLWIKKNEPLNDTLPIDRFVSVIIRTILFPTLKIILNHDSFRSVILNDLSKNQFVKIELRKIIKEEAALMAESNINSPSLYIQENSELSYSEQEIYRDLKIYSIEK